MPLCSCSMKLLPPLLCLSLPFGPWLASCTSTDEPARAAADDTAAAAPSRPEIRYYVIADT